MKNGTFAEALKVNFTTEQAGFLGRFGGETRDEIMEDIEAREEAKKRNPTMLKRFVCAFLVYSADIGFALTGWVYGFGMEVKNWPALIGTAVFARFFFHILAVALYASDAEALKQKRRR